MLKTSLAKLLTVKAAAAAIAVTAAGGGVALAASNGALPFSLGAGNANSQASAHASGKPATAGEGEHGSASPSPSLVGLCRAYAAGVHDNPGKALDNPAFGALIAAAGAMDKVTGYCTELLKDEPGGAPAAKPSGPSNAKPTPSHPTPPDRTTTPRVNPTP